MKLGLKGIGPTYIPGLFSLGNHSKMHNSMAWLNTADYKMMVGISMKIGEVDYTSRRHD
jgi:hypothetical protein